jgi:branched-subunit amino acid transport protein
MNSVSQTTIWGVIVGMAVLNYAVRYPPIAIVSRMELPRPIMRWLSFIPIAVMGALISGEVLRPAGQWVNPATSPNLYAALITAIVFKLTRSFLGATVAGMASFVVLQRLIPLLLG